MEREGTETLFVSWVNTKSLKVKDVVEFMSRKREVKNGKGERK